MTSDKQFFGIQVTLLDKSAQWRLRRCRLWTQVHRECLLIESQAIYATCKIRGEKTKSGIRLHWRDNIN